MKVVSGLALPLNATYENTIIYNDNTKVIAADNIPLFVNHDISKPVGHVLSFVKKDDGLYYVAEVEDSFDNSILENLSVSIGAKYDGLTNTLLIYELSLTPNPYFQTDLSVVLSKKTEKNIVEIDMKSKEIKAQEDMQEHTTAVSAQDLDTLERVVQEHASAIAEMQSLVSELQSNMQALAERISALESALATTQESLASKLQEHVQQTISASTSSIISELDGFLSSTLSKMLQQLVNAQLTSSSLNTKR